MEAPAARSGQVETAWPKVALLSLSDKQGAAEFARILIEHGAKLIASAGTAAHLAQTGVEVTRVEDWIAFPELMGGRVKTLHPHVHAAILARREVAEDLQELASRGLAPIDLVAVTLYPFEERAGSLRELEALEEVDIGGVALLRAAAKNYPHVIVLHSSSQYDEVIAALERGGPTMEERREWAIRTFARTAGYDAAIAAELGRRSGSDPLPRTVVLALERKRTLRYGENPHQRAAVYARPGGSAPMEGHAGKELSYNNLVDVAAAVRLAGRFLAPSCVIVKHNEPCGAACAGTLIDAYRSALKSDELSAFGGVVAFNRPLDAPTATTMLHQFVECVAAPQILPGVQELLSRRRNLRVVRLAPEEVASPEGWSLRLLGPWALLQTPGGDTPTEWEGVTQRVPSEEELSGLRFAWEVAAAARSNAVAMARGTSLVGLGSGQTSRVDAVDVAILKARRAGHDLKGVALASDGFFPFPDGVLHASDAGVTAVVQPGGSVRDAEVIAACDRRGMAMMFTRCRVFRH